MTVLLWYSSGIQIVGDRKGRHAWISLVTSQWRIYIRRLSPCCTVHSAKWWHCWDCKSPVYIQSGFRSLWLHFHTHGCYGMHCVHSFLWWLLMSFLVSKDGSPGYNSVCVLHSWHISHSHSTWLSATLDMYTMMHWLTIHLEVVAHVVTLSVQYLYT